jgi:pyruvate/2-oxoglutarate dehydrogenase complex dihydrolipoamide acyltransferase (E2) component
MIYRLVVPGPIDDVEELRVLEWTGEVGRAYLPGELIVELETHKAVVEVRAGQPGILRAVLCASGDWEKVGCPLAVLSDSPDEAIPDSLDGLKICRVDFEVI